MRKDAITITREQLLEASSAVTASKNLKPLISELPSMIMTFAIFSSLLCAELFDKDEESEGEE